MFIITKPHITKNVQGLYNRLSDYKNVGTAEYVAKHGSKNNGAFNHFDSQFFNKHKKFINWFANTEYGREIFCIDIDSKIKIDVMPNRINWKDGNNLVTQFSTHQKYSKRIYWSFKEIWEAFHWFDMKVANKYAPALNLGFDTLVVWPDPHPEVNTVDGYVGRISVGSSFSGLRDGAGTIANDSTARTDCCLMRAGASLWDRLHRGFLLFDTSPLTAAAVISESALKMVPSGKRDDFANLSYIHYADANIASNTALATGDFQSVSRTSFASKWIAATTNGVPFTEIENASGIAAVNLTGVTQRSVQTNWDLNDGAPTWQDTGIADHSLRYSEETGTGSDPQLTITYTAAAEGQQQQVLL